jgi:precorrin-3B C17-methyltransferase
MTGALTIAGLGPGSEALMTPEVSAALSSATDILGYAPYVARVVARPGLTLHPSDNREELQRATEALRLASEGHDVVVVSSGDPGVFAMASAVFEALEASPQWRDLPIRVLPGITAMLAAAARIGAPLGHDFCAISLSDNLKPWALVERRLDAVAGAGFVIALYNPVSRARPWQFGQAIERLRKHLPQSTPVVFGRAVGRPGENVDVTTLGDADKAQADMATLVIVGSRETRVIARPGQSPLVYTPRATAEVSV